VTQGKQTAVSHQVGLTSVCALEAALPQPVGRGTGAVSWFCAEETAGGCGWLLLLRRVQLAMMELQRIVLPGVEQMRHVLEQKHRLARGPTPLERLDFITRISRWGLGVRGRQVSVQLPGV